MPWLFWWLVAQVVPRSYMGRTGPCTLLCCTRAVPGPVPPGKPGTYRYRCNEATQLGAGDGPRAWLLYRSSHDGALQRGSVSAHEDGHDMSQTQQADRASPGSLAIHMFRPSSGPVIRRLLMPAPKDLATCNTAVKCQSA